MLQADSFILAASSEITNTFKTSMLKEGREAENKVEGGQKEEYNSLEICLPFKVLSCFPFPSS